MNSSLEFISVKTFARSMRSLLTKTIQIQINQERGAFSHRCSKFRFLLFEKFLLPRIKKMKSSRKITAQEWKNPH